MLSDRLPSPTADPAMHRRLAEAQGLLALPAKDYAALRNTLRQLLGLPATTAASPAASNAWKMLEEAGASMGEALSEEVESELADMLAAKGVAALQPREALLLLHQRVDL